MTEIIDMIPIRCRGCNLFVDDVTEANKIDNKQWALETKKQRVEERGEEYEDYGALSVANELERTIFCRRLGEKVARYTVNCPGPDLSDMVGTGETTHIAVCRSPVLENDSEIDLE
jgi:hypothetical protein